MWEWLLSSMDTARPHDVSTAVSWHARSMVLAWGVIAPLAVIVARFFKIMPGQDWPRQLDSQIWWRTHWIGHSFVFVLCGFGALLILPNSVSEVTVHNWLGFAVLVALVVQVLLGFLRGSKGGPTAPAADGSPRGHHFDMSPWRRAFEASHKTLGYGVLVLAAITLLSGLSKANAPNWMWVSLVIWWVVLVVVFAVLQRHGMAVDTYQAIWGGGRDLPGNRLPHPGWGVRRPGDEENGDNNVRHSRGNRVRDH